MRIALKEKEEKEKERREHLEIQKQREIEERKRYVEKLHAFLSLWFNYGRERFPCM